MQKKLDKPKMCQNRKGVPGNVKKKKNVTHPFLPQILLTAVNSGYFVLTAMPRDKACISLGQRFYIDQLVCI
jgi:hypothetical protein